MFKWRSCFRLTASTKHVHCIKKELEVCIRNATQHLLTPELVHGNCECRARSKFCIIYSVSDIGRERLKSGEGTMREEWKEELRSG